MCALSQTGLCLLTMRCTAADASLHMAQIAQTFAGQQPVELSGEWARNGRDSLCARSARQGDNCDSSCTVTHRLFLASNACTVSPAYMHIPVSLVSMI